MSALYKLGKRPRRDDPRTLRLASYAAGLPTPPTAVSWPADSGLVWPMDGNDTLGDCTCAAVAHLIQMFTACASSAPVVMPTAQVIALYEKFGYNPADPSTDEGACEIDVLNYWRNTGVLTGPAVAAPDKIAAYASINPANSTEVKQAIAAFGAIYVGVNLPTSAQGQAVWDVTPSSPGDAGSWGGHAIPIIGYDATTLACVTWGAVKLMTWAWFSAYCDEAYAVLTPDWIESDGESPSGLNLSALQADLALIK